MFSILDNEVCKPEPDISAKKQGDKLYTTLEKEFCKSDETSKREHDDVSLPSDNVFFQLGDSSEKLEQKENTNTNTGLFSDALLNLKPTHVLIVNTSKSSDKISNTLTTRHNNLSYLYKRSKSWHLDLNSLEHCRGPTSLSSSFLDQLHHNNSDLFSDKRFSLQRSLNDKFSDKELGSRTSVSNSSISKKKLSPRGNRLTAIAVVITIGFILSYFPHIILVILRTKIVGFEHDLDTCTLIIYNIFLRSPMLNTVVNIFVYGTMNKQFKIALVSIVKRNRS